MKKKLNKKQITVILLGVILAIVIVAGSVTAVLMLNSGNKSDKKTGSSNVSSEEISSADATGSADIESDESSDKIYISDCDSTDPFEEQENIQLITDEGMIKQGKGAFLNSSTSPLFFSAKLKKAVDISPLKGGYVHFSLYVANKNNFVKNIFANCNSNLQ